MYPRTVDTINEKNRTIRKKKTIGVAEHMVFVELKKNRNYDGNMKNRLQSAGIKDNDSVVTKEDNKHHCEKKYNESTK